MLNLYLNRSVSLKVNYDVTHVKNVELMTSLRTETCCLFHKYSITSADELKMTDFF